MRLVALSLLYILNTLAFASEFPKTFNSAGDEVYANMQKYMQIRDLEIYKERPEVLEAFCLDANNTMKKGFALDKMKEDLEAKTDKMMIKSYVKELRSLSNQNEAIYNQLQKDILALYKKNDFKSLQQIREAGFTLSPKIMKAIKEQEKKDMLAQKSKIKKVVLNTVVPVQTLVLDEEVADQNSTKKEAEPSHIEISDTLPVVVDSAVESVPAAAVLVKAPIISAPKIAVVEPEHISRRELPPENKPSELVYYETSLSHLKDELYALRESEDTTQTGCLNDITAINYWMIRVLQNENDACALSDAIRQMKSYDKSSAVSCGQESMRYVEWHGRIKPYVGQKLFQAEALCHK